MEFHPGEIIFKKACICLRRITIDENNNEIREVHKKDDKTRDIIKGDDELGKFTVVRIDPVKIFLAKNKSSYCPSIKDSQFNHETKRSKKNYPIKSVTCYHCNKVFYQKNLLQEHISIHYKEPYASSEANKSLDLHIEKTLSDSEKSTLSQNVSVQLGKESFYNCNERLFSVNHSEESSSIVPNSENVVSSQTRSTEFPFPIDLNELPSHKPSFYSSNCSLSSPSEGKNTNSTSLNKKIFACNHCSNTFSKRPDLIMHFVSVHSDKRLFSCKFCNKKFTNNSNLRKHSKVHFANKVFTCDICKKSFHRKDHLKSHILMHAFPCGHCNRSFKTEEKLNKHTLVHSNEKTFTCDQLTIM